MFWRSVMMMYGTLLTADPCPVIRFRNNLDNIGKVYYLLFILRVTKGSSCFDTEISSGVREKMEAGGVGG